MELENKVLTSAVLNNTLCRICLSSNENNQCIFRMNQDDYERMGVLNFPQKLQLCSGIEIQENDGLPTSICAMCILKVNAAYTLREQSQKADAKLRELCGIPLKKYNILSSPLVEDKCCQTEQFPIDHMKQEADLAENLKTNTEDSLSVCENKNNKKDKSNLLQNIEPPEEVRFSNDQFELTENDDTNVKDIEHEKPVIKKETLRQRKLSMFKMVTSMESLKNHKERQRQYIKKSLNNKHDASDKNLQNKKTTCKLETFSNPGCKAPHKCPECGQCYLNKSSLSKHILTHSKKTLNCDKCDTQFFNFNKLLEHSKLHAVKEKATPVQCKICEKNFRKTDTMVRHLNVHKRANPKEVFSILKEIRDKRKLENNPGYVIESSKPKINMKELDSNGDAKLKSNKTVLESQENTNFNHSSLSDTEPKSDNDLESLNDSLLYHCNQCTKHYSSERSLQRHLLVHDEKKFVCNVCNMKFFRQDRLKSHKDKHGHNQDKECLELQKPPDDKSAIKLINSWIREELDSDNEGKGFPCKICGKSYDTKKSLLKHEINVHSTQHGKCTDCEDNCTCLEKDKDQEKIAEKSKPFICSVCNKSFEKENKLQKHMRIHERSKEQQDTNFKRFLCHICSKTFRQNTGLMFHMRTHTGYKPHVCKYCGRGFTSNSNCINHERTHTGDRPFVCHFCSAAFAKSCTLKAHITTHTGEANYHCKTCGKSFRRLKYLKEHRFTHTGEKPYACKICGTAYSHSGSLFVHEKKCKAQYNNYQALSIQSTQSYCQSQTNVSSSMPIISSNIAAVAPSHIGNINNTVAVQANKSYLENVQRINAHSVAAVPATGSSGMHPHQNQGVIDSAAPARGFTIIGQIFQS